MLIPVLFGQAVIVFYLGLRRFKRKMAEMIDRRLEKSDALLFLTEQHTRMNELHKEQMKRNIEQVKRQVEQVPEATASAVVEKIDGHGSQDGTTLKAPPAPQEPPAYLPPPGAVS